MQQPEIRVRPVGDGDRPTIALAAQGQAWHRALSAAGRENKLFTVPDADHIFSSGSAQQQLRQAATECSKGITHSSGDPVVDRATVPVDDA